MRLSKVKRGCQIAKGKKAADKKKGCQTAKTKFKKKIKAEGHHFTPDVVCLRGGAGRRSWPVLVLPFLPMLAPPFLPPLAAFYVHTAEGVAAGCSWVRVGCGMDAGCWGGCGWFAFGWRAAF